MERTYPLDEDFGSSVELTDDCDARRLAHASAAESVRVYLAKKY